MIWETLTNRFAVYNFRHSVTCFSKDCLGHELVTEVCLFVTFWCLWSRTLYKEKTPAIP